MKKITTLSALLFITVLAFSQNKCNDRLLKTSNDITGPSKDTLCIKNIYFSFWSDSVIIKTKDKNKLAYPMKDLWGYCDSEGTIYRNYNRVFYKINQNGSLVIYSLLTPIFVSNVMILVPTYYFSKTLDSPIYNLSFNKIKEQYNDNPCFLDKITKDFKWYQDAANFEKDSSTYKIVKTYDSCK